MAKVGASIGLTMKIKGKNEEESFIKPEVSIKDIDTELPFNDQIEAVIPVAKKVMDTAVNILKTKLNELLTEEYAELDSAVGEQIREFKKYLDKFNQRLIALEEKK